MYGLLDKFVVKSSIGWLRLTSFKQGGYSFLFADVHLFVMFIEWD